MNNSVNRLERALNCMSDNVFTKVYAESAMREAKAGSETLPA
jgi:hypothetical protein